MLSRIKEGVRSTVSNISTALSNPLMREYEIGSHQASAGPHLCWKIYSGKCRANPRDVSIWIFEKRSVDKMSKRDQFLVLDALKRGVQQLTRLRHPKLLVVEHGLEESRDSLAFATEPVFASISNILGVHFNLPSPIPSDLREYELFETELKYGLLQVTEALMFVHNDVKMIHGNVCPNSIILNRNGAWKLAGLEYAIPNDTPNTAEPSFPFREWDPDFPLMAKPSLDYLAPEYVLSKKCSRCSDLFSMGMVFYAVFNRGKPLYECDNVLSTFQKNAIELSDLSLANLKNVPEEARQHIRMLIDPDQNVRPDASQLSKITFFQDVCALTLQFLDTLLQCDKSQKTHFFKGLPKVLEKMPKRVILQRVLPNIVQEFNSQDMVPLVLPTVLILVEQCTNEEYTSKILPHLLTIFLMQEPIEIVILFMQKLNLIVSKTPINYLKSHVFPMMYNALDSNEVHVQEMCLNTLPSFANQIDFPTLKTQVIPRIKRLLLNTTHLAVKVKCLVCMGQMLEYLDRWCVQDDVLPSLQQVNSHEPGVLMAILGIYKIALTHSKLGISKDTIATNCIPFLLRCSIESQLNLTQFNKFMSTIKEMLRQIEREQRHKLEQINALEKEQSAAISSMMNGDSQKGDSADAIFDSVVEKGTKTSEKKEDVFSNFNDDDDYSPSIASSGPLTLEQKQQLMKDKEVQKKLNSQGKLAPVALQPSTKPPTSNESKTAIDLTKTLDANLHLASKPIVSSSSLSFSTGLPQSSYTKPTNQFGTSNQYTGMQSMNLTHGFPPSQNQIPVFNSMNNYFPPQNQVSNPHSALVTHPVYGKQNKHQGPSSLDSLDVFGKGKSSQVPTRAPNPLLSQPIHNFQIQPQFQPQRPSFPASSQLAESDFSQFMK